MVTKAEACMVKSNFTHREREEMWGSNRVGDEDAYEIARGILDDSAQRRRQKKYAALRNNQVRSEIRTFLDKVGDTPDNRKRALQSILVRDLRDESGMVSIEALSQGIEATAQARLADIAEAIRPRRLGFARQTRLMGDVADELHGTRTGNAEARAFAQDVAKLMEDLRQRFNRAGGAVMRLGDWGLPHGHNATKMARVTVQDYIRDVLPLLNRNKYQTPKGRPLGDRQMAELLEATYRSVITDGATDSPFPGAVANRHQEHRELHFKDGPAYRHYAQAYGEDNYWKVITDTVERRSREIALVERLGPNPEKAFQTLAEDLGAPGGLLVTTEAIYRNLAGIQRPDRVVWADRAATVRTMLSAAQLGSATISSITDIGTAAINAAFNGMRWTRMLSRLGSLSGEEGRVFAARMGGSIEYALDNVGIAQRFDDASGGTWAQQAANAVFRASGLSAWTNWMRRAHFAEFSYVLADHMVQPFDALPARFKGMLESYGITADDWRLVRQAAAVDRNGEKFLQITTIPDEVVLTKVMGMVHQEMNLAVLMPDARTRAALNRGMSQDSLGGIAARAFTQYKQFPVAMLFNNLYRYMASKRIDMASRLGYTTSLMAATWLLGGLAAQLKEIDKGRKPRPMDGKFALAAFVQGGGAGILGDFIFSNESRYGQPWYATALGPTGGAAYDIGSMVVKGAETLSEGKGADVTALARYIPGQSLWPTRLVFERYFTDTLGKLAYRDYERNKQAAVRRRKTQHGQEYYWQPGDLAPGE